MGRPKLNLQFFGEKNPKKFWDMKMSSDKSNEADIFIYGDITSYRWNESDTTASSFKGDLDQLGDVSTLNLYINSPGGSVFEGIAIHNMLKRHKAKVNVHVDALAASIASVIAMAGDTIYMPKNSMLMIHNPWTFAIGNATELRKQADDLDRIAGSAFQSYMQKAGDKLTEEKLQGMLDAETWLSADQAFEFGLCDVVESENQMAASINSDLFQRYKNVPQSLIDNPKTTISADEMALRQRIADEAKANQAYLETILGGMYK
ncbi:ATP-dependent Clp endopeptidase proteolytic subunit ClpP [Pullulanibacillus pueri]|uniref:ATP-dependent Clp protease proteolytic subunit n=2 Tax=Pullulanibacillus pueri TaxID=1437324 RepID=A0A8J3EMG9_9BACL|nr:ATP-dependent Clp endopeptidase proteolytic subunit ClpP [Pullulanibacillus pueri]GGH83580.1 ATP-dependent Clp protease proteolytic subunit [Pullulanibacillus pueri]